MLKVAATVTYALQILMALMMISMVFVMFIISQASAERICQVLQERSTVTDPDHPGYELLFETADGVVTSYRSGLAEYVAWIEGCA